MTLHTWNKAVTHTASMSHCLAQLGQDDMLLLLEDGLYAMLDDSFLRRFEACATAGTRLCVLSEDLAARGISARIPRVASVIGYKEFVAQALHHERVVNWI